MAITYREFNLYLQHISREPGTTLTTQTLKNLLSQLASYGEFLGRGPDSLIDSDFGVAFIEQRQKYLGYCLEQGVSDRRRRDRKSLLARLQREFLVFSRLRASDGKGQNPFHEALNQALIGQGSTKSVARKAGIPAATLNRWVNGGIPRAKVLPSLRRLENCLGLASGTLISTMPHLLKSETETAPAPVIAYRERLKRRPASNRVSVFEDEFRAEWCDFLDYKTTLFPKFKRHKNGAWIKRDNYPSYIAYPGWAYIIESPGKQEFVPTATLQFGAVARFFAYVESIKPALGIAKSVQTLTTLTNVEVIKSYLNEYIAASGGSANGGHLSFVTFALTLVHPVTGWLAQQPRLADRYAFADIAGADWLSHCMAAYEELKAVKCGVSGNKAESRDPKEPMKAILDSDAPMRAVGEMLRRMEAELVSPGSVREALQVRDRFLIALLAVNPLRARQLKTMTWRKDGSGSLYQKPDGSWHVRFGKRDFKNHAGAAKTMAFDMRIESFLWPLINQYIHHYRERILGDRVGDYVFVAVSDEDGIPLSPWSSLNTRVTALTRRYLPGCPGGVGPHGFRHIFATAWLKEHPNDWQTVALKLHDTRATVEREYAHLRVNDSVVRVEAAYSGVLGVM